MKKLLFATALVASAAAFADGPINAISFEGYTAGFQFTNGQAEKDEGGTDKQNGPYFLYFGDQDGSSVKAFGGDNAAAPNITRPLAFANASPNANYLDLSTEGGILWRSISNTIQDSGTNKLGTAQAVADDGIYLDTLVQFTPTEDGGTPELTDEDKLAIWLNVDSTATPSVTNLMVRAAVLSATGAPTPTTFTITNKTVNAGQWYRLTVKAIKDMIEGQELPGFQIRLDGDVLMSDTVTVDSDYLEYAQDTEYEEDLLNGALFASLLGSSSSPTLTAVGFKGSGALDDIVWTEEDPFAGGAGGSDYKVVIDGSDVVVTPTVEDLAAVKAAVEAQTHETFDVTDVAAVNAALAAPIPGTTIPSWQALFLGVAPTTNGLETVAIESITIENGTVTVAMSDDLTLMTGRGVDIVLKVLGSNDLTTWDTTNPLATATNTLTIPAITPALGETKKFYKVVVEFAASSAAD